MYQLTKDDCKLISQYKKLKSDEIALYFFNKYRDDVIDIVFYKINRKFNSIPFEKGDLFHLLWNSIKKSLLECKKRMNFNSVLINNCYYLTIKEIKKFLNNNELVMNISTSLENNLTKRVEINSKKFIEGIELPRDVMIKNIVDDVCFYIEKYQPDTIKRVLYLKSLGYTVKEICKKLKMSRHFVDDIIKTIERITRKLYF